MRWPWKRRKAPEITAEDLIQEWEAFSGEFLNDTASGAERPCPNCNGNGEYLTVVNDPDTPPPPEDMSPAAQRISGWGELTVTRQCPACGGSGRVLAAGE